jgi:hypothetical protein
MKEKKKIRYHSHHAWFLFSISVHRPSQPTNLTPPLLFFVSDGSLMSYPILPSSGRKSQHSFALSQISYFCNLEIPGIFGVPCPILQDTGSEPFDKAVPRKRG